MGSPQVQYRPRLEEEVGGDPHATYAYIAADAAAKEKGTEPGAEVMKALQQRPVFFIVPERCNCAWHVRSDGKPWGTSRAGKWLGYDHRCTPCL